MSTPYNFTVEIQEAGGKVCQRALTINVEISCGLSTDYINDPQDCRLKVKNFTPTFVPVCGACPLGGSVDWDGTLTVKNAGTPAPDAYYMSALTFDRFNTMQLKVDPLNGGVRLRYNHLTGNWTLELVCLPGAFWQGILHAVNPIGIYNTIFDCSGIVPTIEIEGFLPP